MLENPFFDLVLIALPIGLAVLWWDGSRSRELAIEHARRVCQHHGVQLLDQTVARVRSRLVRDHTGRRRIERLYRFEFSSEGAIREGGEVSMIGQQLRDVTLPWVRDAHGNRVFLQ